MSCGKIIGKQDVGYAVNELSDGYVAGGGLYKDGFQKSAKNLGLYSLAENIYA